MGRSEGHQPMGRGRFGVMRYLFREDIAIFLEPSEKKEPGDQYTTYTIKMVVFHTGQADFSPEALDKELHELRRKHEHRYINDASIIKSGAQRRYTIEFTATTQKSMHRFEGALILYFKQRFRNAGWTSDGLPESANNKRESYERNMKSIGEEADVLYRLYDKGRPQFALDMCLMFITNGQTIDEQHLGASIYTNGEGPGKHHAGFLTEMKDKIAKRDRLTPGELNHLRNVLCIYVTQLVRMRKNSPTGHRVVSRENA